MLQEAFNKARLRDLDRINFLKKDNNPQNIESIYSLYNDLKNRQEVIKPLLPLPILDQNKNASFQFANYDDEIIATK